VKTLPGNGGMVTLALSRSNMSRKYSKSEYRRRTTEWRSLKAGMLVRVWISYEVYMFLGDEPCVWGFLTCRKASRQPRCSKRMDSWGDTDFDLEEVLRRTIDLFKGLLARVW
jgi:hypothetical protein